jgi:RNA polymerase sigma-70 factor (ECF subfamily)
MQDQEILIAIRRGGSAKRIAVHHIFTSHQAMMGTVKSKLSLSSEQIKDMYADAVSAVVWNIDTNKFKGDSKLSSYLYKILYNKSVDLIRHNTTNKNIAYEELTGDSSSLVSEDLERKLEVSIDVEQVKAEILKMGKPCSDILIDWAYWGYTMNEIAERNELESADKAKKKKYSCMKKLRALLNTKGIN